MTFLFLNIACNKIDVKNEIIKKSEKCGTHSVRYDENNRGPKSSFPIEVNPLSTTNESASRGVVCGVA
jgi:hypothetical protein